jgi:hypothetical protein
MNIKAKVQQVPHAEIIMYIYRLNSHLLIIYITQVAGVSVSSVLTDARKFQVFLLDSTTTSTSTSTSRTIYFHHQRCLCNELEYEISSVR